MKTIPALILAGSLAVPVNAQTYKTKSYGRENTCQVKGDNTTCDYVFDSGYASFEVDKNRLLGNSTRDIFGFSETKIRVVQNDDELGRYMKENPSATALGTFQEYEDLWFDQLGPDFMPLATMRKEQIEEYVRNHGKKELVVVTKLGSELYLHLYAGARDKMYEIIKPSNMVK